MATIIMTPPTPHWIRCSAFGAYTALQAYQCSGESAHNTCLTTVGVDGTVIGYHTGLGIGSAKPEATVTGIAFYGFTWDYPAVKGDFLIQWGANGKFKVPDVEEIFIKGPNSEVGVAPWNDTANAYVVTDLAMAEQLNIAYDAGELEPFCFLMMVLPTEFIRISYTEMLIGA